MRALVIDAPHSMALREVPFSPQPGECRVHVRMAGICGTDLQLLEGYADFRGIPGHEFVGVVDAVSGPDDARWLGTRVVGEINVGCGICHDCRLGVKEHCAVRTVTGIRGRSGAFAEYLSLPAGNLHAVPDAVDDETAVFVEPTAAACRILEQVALNEHSHVAVVGDGRMGLIVAQVLRTVTADVTLIGRHDRKLAVARALGLNARRIADLPGGAGRFDVAVDVTGRSGGLQLALELARPRGTVVMKTTVHGEAPFTSWPAVVNEVTLVGSRCGPFAPALALLASGAVQVRPLISRVAPIEDFAAAFADARGKLKVLFTLTPPADRDAPGPVHPTAQRVQAALRSQGSAAMVIQVPDSTRTAAEAAAALGTSVGAIVKSMVFLANEQPLLVLTSGSERVSTEKVRALIGATVTRADAETVRRLTGYSIGGIPPLAHDTPARVLMDPHLLQFDVVWAAAGTPHAVFGIAPDELQRVTAAEVADVTE